jgi:hypothetical protein
MAELSALDKMRARVVEERLGVPITKYTAEEWLDKAIESEEVARSGNPQVIPEWWFQASLDQQKAAELAEKLAQ